MISIMVFVFAGYVWAGMPNPAAVYCSELGYQVKTITEDDGGQYSVCVFPDGNSCDAWRFLVGKCGEEYSYCAKNGYGQIIKTDGKNPFSINYPVCVSGSTEIGNPLDLMGITERLLKQSPSENELAPIKPSPQETKPVLEGLERLEGALPNRFDWRTYNGFDWMTPVKDQNQCGACWAFGSTGTVEAVHNLKQNQPNLDINLSEEYVNTDCNGNGKHGCCGGTHEAALAAIRDNGVPDDACLVFDVAGYSSQDCLCDAGSDQDQCRGTCPNKVGDNDMCSIAFCDDACFDVASRLVHITDYYSVGDTVDDIKAALIAHGPLTTAIQFNFAKYGGGYDPATGVYSCGGCGNGCGTNHCVIITGWDDTLGAWIIKNSWGNTDGEPNHDGYRYIAYNDCNVQDRVVWVQPGDYWFPVISVPKDITFADTCAGVTSLETLNICNTGKADLSVYSIASSDPQFVSTTPLMDCHDLDGDGIVEVPDECSGGYPVIISPDSCYPFEVKFSPTSAGQKTATLTIRSSDIGHPAIKVTANGNGVQPAIATVIANSGDFGDVCFAFGGSFKDLPLTINNVGGCDLVVTGISSSSVDFKVPATSFPLVISPGGSTQVPIRFEPGSRGLNKTANITVASNDPSTPNKIVAVSGSAPPPEIVTTIANSGNFGDVCIGSYKDLDLTINNSGKCNLNVTSIVGSSEFIVPTGVNYPIRISPASSTSVPIRLQPSSLGSKTGTIQVSSDDPTTPNKVVAVSGNVPPGKIKVTGSTDFGDVCLGTLAEKTISVNNVGKCNLNVSSASFVPACPDFTLINNPFPATVSPDSHVDLVIQFTPTSAGPKSCTLVISSSDPDQPTITLTVKANTPFASINVPPDLCFSPTVIQSVGPCSSTQPFPISNKGICNLTITEISIDSPDYSLSGLPSYPIILEPGHVVGEGNLKVVFKPTALIRSIPATITVRYVSDPVTGATTVITRTLEGEGVRTGARVLVTAGGVPLAKVEKIQIQRISGNKNKKIVDTVDVAQNVLLQTATPPPPCAAFQYHREYGTISNQIQLLPGSYQVTASAIVNGKRVSKTVGFNLDTCGFNPTIVIQF